jgi:hypothetical protein
MIDPATGWFEIQQYDDKQSIPVANILEQERLSRYPWPTQATFDRGSQFIGQDFQKKKGKTYYSKKPTGKCHCRKGSPSDWKYNPNI